MHEPRQLLAIVLVVSTHTALACTPLPQERYESTEKRVKERFASVDSVELVTLERADMIKVKEGGIDFAMDAERAVFRIDRVYKGKMKPGQRLVITSSSSCAFSVVGNPKFKHIYDTRTGKPLVPSKQWLLYRNAGARTEITDSDLTRPASEAAFDIGYLERLRQR